MDLPRAEQLNDRLWQHAKVAALLCFLLANLLLLASLLSPAADTAGGVAAEARTNSSR